MRFVLETLVELEELRKLRGYEEATPDMVEAVLSEAAKLAAQVLSPLNHVGDIAHAKWSEDGVSMPQGFAEAYAEYRDGGWNSLPFDPEWGGQGLPWAVAFGVQEMLHAANMAFGLCPMLNQGAVELLEAHGTTEQKQTFLTKLISGEWTGTMNLTEPQAGSDLGPVRTKAIRQPDGTYRISGQKIFITYGDHELAENIIHMVLARTPDAPEGTKGLGLFIVPKYQIKETGELGDRNDVACVSIESKMGIHASPTCTMAFGERTDGAVGYLVGEPQSGIRMMFTMMNNARLAVGLQGVAISARAYHQALAFAQDRVQSRSVSDPNGAPVAIIEHPDVRRMLLSMRALTEAGRSLVYVAVGVLDRAKRDKDPERRAGWQRRVDFLTPIVKAWCTDNGCEVASMGVQVHGGMGYIEETGAAQHLRDARIAPIYEGTNGIQAADLVYRKVARDKGEAADELLAEIAEFIRDHEDSTELKPFLQHLKEAIGAIDEATRWIVAESTRNPTALGAGSRPYLEMWGITVSGYYLLKGAKIALERLAADEEDKKFYSSKVTVAGFFADTYLTRVSSLRSSVCATHNSIMAFDF
ncbi:MAG: acyl-CoA dehydrogenase C-terminal domain-containing protein [Myxococcales bacterium]|nr:acyl-CoA dehydrogenase C-terminal domain-containing protein [Myxococcales bacterium]